MPGDYLQRDYGSQLAEQLGTQGASGIIGEGMGLLFAGANRANADAQQQDFTNMQEQANEKLSAFNANQQYNEQMKMWQNTNYPAQVGELEQAGMNPALLYGKGGGGGTTTGNITGGGSVGGGQANAAPNPGLGILNAQQQQQTESQIELTQAQKANVDADTANKEAENPNIPKTGKLIDTQTASLTQGIENQKTVQALNEAQTAATNITAENVQTQTKTIEDNIMLLDNDVQISNATKDAKIQTIMATATNTLIQGEVMKMGIQVNQEQIQKMGQDIAQGWAQLGQTDQERQAHIQQMLSQAGLMDKEKSLLLTQTIIQGVGAIGNMIGKVKGNPTTINPK